MAERDDRSGWQANLPPRWLNDSTYRGLSAHAWTLHTWTLVWGVSQENDGELTRRDLPFIASPMLSRSEAEAAAEELVEAGLWEVTADGYRVTDWPRSQVTAAEIAAKRADWKRKNARRRPAATSETPSEKQADTPGVIGGDSPSNGTLQVGKEGQERKDKPRTTTERAPRFGTGSTVDERTGEVTSWATVEIPADDPGEWASPDAPGSILGRGAA